ncbi:MAG TPA: Asp-tRNA(Asn)/Glu-tRNA(Gln) amidotransferase subunit GatA [Elusimicrobiota bacterium]|nr:Asp-tRNA(Asn)/Glu-tRNA(Gln) amidotransferase subunit GatA [Elusimicrobiota bacterium]
MSVTWTARNIADHVRAKKLSAQAVLQSFLERQEKWEPKIQSFLVRTRDQALVQARQIDERVTRGEPVGPLAGVPIAIKDNMCVQGLKTTCASKILESFVAPYDATVIRRLREADAVLVGKTNMDEFAMGSSTENSAFQTTRNPWNTDCIPGGSSGGSAAAVAARLAAAALGSDTGGSIRQPAACCGVVGLKPTYGLVSRYGLVAFASSLDQIGPFTWNVGDAALILQVIAGHDPLDSTSVDRPVPHYTNALTGSVKGLRIGLPDEYFVKGLDPEVERAVLESVRVFESLGATVQKISLPHTEYAVAVYYILAPSEASANLARYDGVRYGHRSGNAKNLLEQYELSRQEGFGSEVKRRIMLGTYALSAGYYDAYYLKAQKVRTLIQRDFDSAFKQVDVILTPTAPTPAFRLGEKSGDPLQMYLSDIFTISCNMAGLPGLSMPCGFSSAGLPIGLQLMGRPFEEETVLNAAHSYEQATSWVREPTLS